MNAGVSLVALTKELERQVNAKHDYIAPSKQITVNPDVRLELAGHPDVGSLGINDYSHGQFAAHLDIPRPYYERMRTEAPALLATNMNEWLQRDDRKRLVRTLDGNVRAFLSNSYRPLDNYDLATAALPALQSAKVKVISSAVTERSLYFKGIVEDRAIGLADLGWAGSRGDAIIPAIEFSNSEVGAGSLSIVAGYYLTSCTNLSMWKDLGLLRKYHVGRELDEGELAELYTDATRTLADRAFWSKVKDAIAGAIRRDIFEQRINTLEEARGRKIENVTNLDAVVEVTLTRFASPGTLSKVVAETLAKSDDLTAYGLSNAITAVAGTFGADRYELSTRMEHVGGEIIDLDGDEWRIIATGAGQRKTRREAKPNGQQRRQKAVQA
jgi:hypothetical protein